MASKVILLKLSECMWRSLVEYIETFQMLEHVGVPKPELAFDILFQELRTMITSVGMPQQVTLLAWTPRKI